jgi:alkanesulfonate monooxygenase SsuD/methylene tetrahydromethanopterin reductase-like flavin-dependent oxidoreductase (luciferase family)
MHVGAGIFFQNLGNERPDADIYAHELGMADAIEPLGFDSGWTAEHHFTDYHLAPSPLQFLSWLAGRTKRIQLGSMVVVLPWHNPVRVAEELCTLDQMSRGRALIGLGRGLGRVEFEGFQFEMAESRQRFVEYSEALINALETGKLAYDGELLKQRSVDIRPGPYASFRGRVYASAVSPESARIMAQLGIGILLIAQKPWPTIVAELDNYREIYRELNGVEAPKPLLVSYVACHESESAALEMHEEYTVRYCRSALEHYEFGNERLAKIPGYEYYGKLAQRIAKDGPEEFTKLLASLQVRGTPAQVTEQVVEIVRRIDAGGIIGVFSHGNMPHELARQNMDLFATQVLPALTGIDSGPAPGSVPSLASR